MDTETSTTPPQDDAVESRLDTPEVVQLDPEGDATLVINGSGGTEQYRISSRVLSLASPVFSKMFGPYFKEGIEIRSGDHPCINLEEDDPTAMAIILRILHHKCAKIPLTMDPKPCAILALHADKYDCNEALRPWILHWCSDSERTSPENLGYMLLAAYMFRSPSFSSVSANAVKQLQPDFTLRWGEDEVLSLLPDRVTGLATFHSLIRGMRLTSCSCVI